jgi:putative FmdB family regulatory protein
VPLYEYQCAKCHHRFELIEKYNAPETHKCPNCGGKGERQIAAPAIQFKGSGWYVTDYAGKNSSANPSEGEKSDKAGEKAEKSAKAEQSDKAGNSEKLESSGKTTNTEKKDSKSEKVPRKAGKKG